MKHPDDVLPGLHPFGAFSVSLQPAHPGKDEWWEVFIYETATRYYVNLAQDPRFAWFGTFGKLDREILPDELGTYNVHVDRKHLAMPTYRLSRHAVTRLYAACLQVSKRMPRVPKGTPL